MNESLRDAGTATPPRSDACDADWIELRIDNQPQRAPAGTTLAQLVARLGHAPRDVGTAVNGVFVPRHEREARTLQSGDAVLLFQPIVGG